MITKIHVKAVEQEVFTNTIEYYYDNGECVYTITGLKTGYYGTIVDRLDKLLKTVPMAVLMRKVANNGCKTQMGRLIFCIDK